MSNEQLQEYTQRVSEQSSSINPTHAIEDHDSITEGGYRGGGGINSDSDTDSNHSGDSALGATNIATIQPYATNLANYLENYKRDPNAFYGVDGFPRMDERSLN